MNNLIRQMFLASFCLTFLLTNFIDAHPADLIVVTVATKETDGLLRLKHSSNNFGINLNIFKVEETNADRLVV